MIAPPVWKDSWPLILGGLIRRPWAWLVILAAVAALFAAPLMYEGEPGFGPPERPEVLRASERVRSFEALERVRPGDDVSVDLYDLARPYDRATGEWATPPAEAFRRLIDSGVVVTALATGSLPTTPEHLALLGGMRGLERLEVGRWSDTGPLRLNRLPAGSFADLRVLDASRQELNAGSVSDFASLPRLEALAIDRPEVDAALSTTLAAFPNLRRLYLEPPADPRAAAEALRPLRDAPHLEELVLEVFPDRFPQLADALKREIPGVELRGGIQPGWRFPVWLMSFGAAGVLSLLGVQMVLWTSGPLPAAVPGFAAAHRRVAWVLAGLCVVASSLSAWASGVPLVLALPGFAALFGVLWWMSLSGTVSAGAGDPTAKTADRWLPLLPIAALAGVLVLLLWQRTPVLTAACGLLLAGVAVVSAVRLDPWLRGTRRRESAKRLEGADLGFSRNAAVDRMAGGEHWPLKPDPGRTAKRVFASAVIGGFACVLVFLLDLGTDDLPMLAILAPAPGSTSSFSR